MAQPPLPPYRLTDLTILAEKYGHPTGTLHESISYQFPFKSGLTPLPNPPFATDQETRDFLYQETYQRTIFSGLIASEIHAVEGLAPMLDPIAVFLDDTVQIHPLYQRQRWSKPLGKHLALYPLAGGRPGYWEAANPTVWAAIVPALRMASLFLSSAHFWPWWDALVAGQYDRIPMAKIPEPYKQRLCNKFQRRDPVIAAQPEERAKLQAIFLKTCKTVNFGFISARVAGMFGGMMYGCVEPHTRYVEGNRLLIAFELAEPLLRNDSTTAERAVDLFRFATTLIHETAHAVWAASVRYENRANGSLAEPFFENEVIAELGFSLENALFGGFALDIISNRQGPDERHTSAAGILQGSWNTAVHENYVEDHPCLIPHPPNFNVSDLWMIPVHMFLNLNNKAFWEGYVQKYGNDQTVLYLKPKTIGVRCTKKPNLLGNDSSFNPISWPRVVELAPAPSVMDYAPKPISYNTMDAQTIAALEFENKRRALAQKVHRALTRLLNRRSRLVRPSTPPPSPPILPFYRATQNYAARDNSELSLTMDDPVMVTRKNSDGYWDCSNFRAQSGLVASNMLREETPIPLLPRSRRPPVPEHVSRIAPITGARYDEIRDYLLKNIRELALDTMDFPMPEHILFNYVLVNGGLNITADEWRDFLITSEGKGLLFHLNDDGPGFGVITKIPAGWPATPLPPRPRPAWGVPTRAMMSTFEKCVAELFLFMRGFENGYQDHDWEDYRRACNIEYLDNPEWAVRTRLGIPIKEFTKEIFEAIVWQSDRTGGEFTFGPKGVIRKRKKGDQPTKKRKRGIADICYHM